ncbi:MAG: DUF2183 domain-containing protein [Planctomycetales bacterium]|nr:DUF2183 domain-containing protein [Planctomycetales bacterium]
MHRELCPFEQVILYPSFGFRTEAGGPWTLDVTGAVRFAAEGAWRKAIWCGVLRRMLQVEMEELDKEVFRRRVAAFMTLSKRGRTVSVAAAGAEDRLDPIVCRTLANGQFRGTLLLSEDQVEELRSVTLGGSAASIATDREGRNGGQRTAGLLHPMAGTSIALRVISPYHRGGASPCGHVHLLEPSGVSVISDIDDTIKLSDVIHRRKLLENTFLREFEPVPGMAEVYRDWQQQSAAFHYVSSSPWQLFDCLNAFLAGHEFPVGSIHLRPLHFQGMSLLRLLLSRPNVKQRTIRGIFQRFPQRRFVLVGDSGERDPEIYAAVAEEFPMQIERILIRRLAGSSDVAARLTHVFRNLTRQQWQMFDGPDELPRSLE